MLLGLRKTSSLWASVFSQVFSHVHEGGRLQRSFKVPFALTLPSILGIFLPQGLCSGFSLTESPLALPFPSSDSLPIICYLIPVLPPEAPTVWGIC